MMAKPIRALELHYPMIQFLIKLDIFLRSEYFMRFLAKKKIQRLQKVLWHLTNCKNLVKQDPIAPPITTKQKKPDTSGFKYWFNFSFLIYR